MASARGEQGGSYVMGRSDEDSGGGAMREEEGDRGEGEGNELSMCDASLVTLGHGTTTLILWLRLMSRQSSSIQTFEDIAPLSHDLLIHVIRVLSTSFDSKCVQYR